MWSYPYGSSLTDKQVLRTVGATDQGLSPNYYPVIQVDHSYVDLRQH